MVGNLAHHIDYGEQVCNGKAIMDEHCSRDVGGLPGGMVDIAVIGSTVEA